MMMAIVLGVLVVAVLVVLAIAAKQPDEFRVTRSTLVKATAEELFPQVNVLQNWHGWSPWVRLDPEAVYQFEGPPAGVGAVTRWVGKKTGEGVSTITESRPSDFIRFRLDFIKPMKATNTAEFTFNPEGNHTNVSWTMYGKNNFMGKLIGLFMNCERMVGEQFQSGLENLKALAEAKAKDK